MASDLHLIREEMHRIRRAEPIFLPLYIDCTENLLSSGRHLTASSFGINFSGIYFNSSKLFKFMFVLDTGIGFKTVRQRDIYITATNRIWTISQISKSGNVILMCRTRADDRLPQNDWE